MTARAGRGRSFLLALALVLTAGCVAPAPRAAQYGIEPAPRTFSRFSAGIGYRGYDDSWSPFDDAIAFQFAGQHEWPSFPVGIEYGLGFSGTDEEVGFANLSSTNFDLWLGPTHTFPLDADGRFYLNLGGGGQVTFTTEETLTSSGTVDEEWFAGYLHASVFWRAGWDWDFGLDLRWVKGEDLEIAGDERQGESLQVLFVSGFAW